MALNKKKQY